MPLEHNLKAYRNAFYNEYGKMLSPEVLNKKLEEVFEEFGGFSPYEACLDTLATRENLKEAYCIELSKMSVEPKENTEKPEPIENSKPKPESKPIEKETQTGGINMKGLNNDGYDMKAKASEVELVPAGTHQAICIGFFGVGLQEWEYQGAKKQGLKDIAVFQVNEVDENNEPLFITQEYTHSMSTKSKLYAVIKSWLGRAPTADELNGGYDLEKLNGKPCMITVVHSTSTSGNTYANVSNVSQLPKGMVPMELAEDVPDWIINKINTLREKAIKE